MKHWIALTLLTTAQFALALSPKPAPAQQQAITLINATVHTGDGTVLQQAGLRLQGGRIADIGAHVRDDGTGQVIDLQGQHVYPGLILPSSTVGLMEIDSIADTRDENEIGEFNPNVRALVAYNTDSEMIPTLRHNGILLAETTPQGGVVSGTSSVVQLDAWNWEDAAVRVDSGLHINWPQKRVNQFDFSTFSMVLKDNDKYDAQMSRLQQLLADARVYRGEPLNLKLASVKAVFDGKKRLYIHTNHPKAIIDAVRQTRELGLNDAVLVTGQAALAVQDFLLQHKVDVLIDSIHALPQRGDLPLENGYALAARLDAAGLKVGLTYASLMSARNLAFTAGTTVAHGSSPENALRMITRNNAELLGIDADYGTLAIGKSATLFVSRGDVFDMQHNRVTHAFIDGRSIQLDGRQETLYQRYKEKYTQP